MSYIESAIKKHQKKMELVVTPVERQTTLEVRSYLKELLQDALKVQPDIGMIKVGMGTAVVSGDYTVVYEDGDEDSMSGWQYHRENNAQPKYPEVMKLLIAVEEYTQALMDNDLPDIGDIHP